MMIRFSTTAIALALTFAGCHKEEEKSATGSTNASPTATNSPNSKEPAPPSTKKGVRPPTVKDLKRYTKDLTGDGPLVATIETSEGILHCELFEKRAPLTVANFVGLARGLHPFRDSKTGKATTRPYFDGLIFHRVMPGFMVQGGDPTGTGRGGPGYKFANESHPELKHDRPGILSMANAGRNTNGSQFFIMDGVKSQLDGGYSVFGHCKQADVVAKLARVKTIQDGRENSKPVEPPTINKVTVARGMPAATK